MPPTPPPVTLPAATATAEAYSAFADACALIVGNLLAYIFPRQHALGPIALHVYRRITRANQFIRRLMTRLANGSWTAPKPRAARRSNTATRAPRPYISQQFGWLGQKYDFFIRGYFCQLEHLLNTPETQALLAAMPPEALHSLGRKLRPVCRLLGITPPKPLQRETPKRVRPPRPPKERMPRPPRSRRALLRALKSCLKPKGMAIWPDRIAARRKTE